MTRIGRHLGAKAGRRVALPGACLVLAMVTTLITITGVAHASTAAARWHTAGGNRMYITTDGTMSYGAAESAPAASAVSKTHPLIADTCTPGQTYGPWHLVPDSNMALALAYHGPGNLVTVASKGKGDSRFICVDSSGVFVISNDAGNCIRMTDQSNDYQVMEENGCLNDNTNYQFKQFTASLGHYQFENVHFQQWLGTESCPSSDGDVVEGVPNAAGNCLTWLKVSP